MGVTNTSIGLLRGREVRVVVDTGSQSHSFISEELAESLRLPCIEISPIPLQFGNGSGRTVNLLAEEIIEISELRKRVQLKVLPGLPVDIVLGLDSLSIFEVYLLLSAFNDEELEDNYFLHILDEEMDLFPPSEEEADFTAMLDRSLPELREILIKFKDIFKLSVGSAPADLSSLSIQLKADAVLPKGLNAPPRRFSFEDADLIAKEIENMEALGIISKTTSSFHSQLHLVSKKDGTKRICIDFRLLNSITEAVTWPLPHLQDLLHYLRGNAYFAVLDLSSGYWQMPVDEDSKKYTTFISERGTYCFNRVPFGLRNAPSFFQKALSTEVLGELLYNICLLYIDDVVIFGRTQEEFIANVDKVLTRLRDKKIRVKAKKSVFGVREVAYLGHIVSGNTIHISDERRVLFDNFGKPDVVSKLRSFLGSANYFRNHIANYADLAGPLYDLLSGKGKKDRVDWNEAAETAFVALKQAVVEAPTLFHLQPQGQITVYTDASDYAIGGFITQIQEGEERPILFLSRRLTDTEARYAVIEKEMLAIMNTILNAHVYLSGKDFIVRTDHKPLLSMLKTGDNKRVERMKMRLMEYNYVVEHIAGETNVVADSLSRVSMLIENDVSGAIHASTLANWQKAVESGLFLMTKQDVREAASIPEDKRIRIRGVHNQFVGHHGVTRTVDMLREQGYDWATMKEDVELFIKACPNCAAVRSGRSLRGKSFRVYAEAPNTEWSGDSIGPLSKDRFGFEHILVIVEMFSGFVHLRPLRSVGKEECSEILFQLFCQYGVPRRFRSDNAGQFKNHLVEDLLRSWSIEMLEIRPYNSRDNAMVEVRNREVRRHLAALETSEGKPWSAILPRVQLIMNNSARSDIQVAPADILFGHFHSMGRVDQFVPIENRLHLQEAFIDAIHDRNLNADARINQEVTESPIKEGDTVYIRNETRAKSDVANKIWIGPYIVLRVEGDAVHMLGDGTNEIVRHISKVKLFDGSIQDEVSDRANERYAPQELIKIVGHDASRGTQRTIMFKVKFAQEPDIIEVSYADATFKDSPIFHEYCSRHEELKKLIR